MWTEGDYRVTFRHYRDMEADIDSLIGHAIDLGQIEFLSNRARAEVDVVTKAVIQKRITDGELSAWATLSVGYAFCQCRDNFIKRRGRDLAFARALEQLPQPRPSELIMMTMVEIIRKEDKLFQ